MDYKSMRDIQYGGDGQVDDTVISNEGMEALREKLKEMKPEAEEPIGTLTLTTTFVEWEHYMAMREYTSSVLQKDYSLEDLMQALIDAYEVRYNEIVKAHENGDRQVTSSYDPSKAFYTLEEDLAALDWAYEREWANIAAFIVCRQTNDGHKFKCVKKLTIRRG